MIQREIDGRVFEYGDYFYRTGHKRCWIEIVPDTRLDGPASGELEPPHCGYCKDSEQLGKKRCVICGT